ncbi:hypothetical protein [Actinomadura flavalba]|uniref:hypothetical protein n=1 Tax=Actinomadura flavalba TaxID=1120938 RepID=UPI0012DBE76E|nr:hypothetical protein [Actinomadura flavalba]
MRRISLAAAAGATVLALTGCGVLGDDGSPSGGGPGPDRQQPAVAGYVPLDPAKPIVKATVQTQAGGGGTLELGVAELRVKGKLLHLTMVLTPRVGDANGVSVYELNGRHGPDPTLLDTVNLKRHSVVKVGMKSLEPEYVSVRLPAGRPSLQSYVFAAPPDNVRSMDVVYGQWAPFRDVPVAR